MHYYKFNIGDYISHTRHLTLGEDAVYRRLLDAYYLQEHPLNASVASVARQINARDYENEVREILEEFFELTEKGWINVRADKEIAKYHAKAEQASKAGKASAKARSNKPSTSVEHQLNDNLTDEQPNIKQETINNIKEEKPKNKGTQIPDLFIVDPDAIELAKKLGVDYELEKDKFCDYYKGQGKVMKDWSATFRNWIRNAAEYKKSKTVANTQVFDGWLRGAK